MDSLMMSTQLGKRTRGSRDIGKVFTTSTQDRGDLGTYDDGLLFSCSTATPANHSSSNSESNDNKPDKNKFLVAIPSEVFTHSKRAYVPIYVDTDASGTPFQVTVRLDLASRSQPTETPHWLHLTQNWCASLSVERSGHMLRGGNQAQRPNVVLVPTVAREFRRDSPSEFVWHAHQTSVWEVVLKRSRFADNALAKMRTKNQAVQRVEQVLNDRKGGMGLFGTQRTRVTYVPR